MNFNEELQEKVTREIENFHDFFVAWFTGAANPEDLQTIFIPRISNDMVFIGPDGNQISGAELTGGFKKAHGSNSNFRICIRDVRVLHVSADHVLALYTEWQTGAVNSSPPNSGGSSSSSRNYTGRVSTALLTRTEPFRWLHVQETWLPEDVQASGNYSFAKD